MSRFFGRLAAISCACAVSFSTLGQAAPPARRPAREEPKPTTVRLTVYPAAEPRPALKYNFLTPLVARKPGNAAPFYYRAIQAYLQYRAASKGLDMRLDEWAHMPIDKLPLEELRKAVHGFSAYDDLQEATSRERCDWDYRIEQIEGLKGIEFRLAEVQESRGLARYLAVKARLEIAEGRHTDAIATMGLAYQLARDLSTTPIIINGLVCIAIGGILDDQAYAFFAAPKSPNLYWAYTELPRPFIDLRPSVEVELSSPARIFPMLKDPEHAEHSPEQWADIISRAVHTLSRLSSYDQPEGIFGWESRLAATGLALRGYTQAKRDLIATGYDAAKVEQMPVGQVLAIDEANQSHYIADEMRKWTLVSYPDGWRRMKDAARELIQNRYLNPGLSSREVIPINSVLLPAVESAGEASIRRDISIAANRVIEAIRMQAAQNGGKLPQSLSDVTVVPVPVHPRFGTPFPYKLEGDKATLEVRRVSDAKQRLQEGDYIFELTIRH